jgi:hypothetical protein
MLRDVSCSVLCDRMIWDQIDMYIVRKMIWDNQVRECSCMIDECMRCD